MTGYDLIAFDMDGTLLDSSKRVRPDSLKAISAAVAAGKHVAISTGRCMPEILPVIRELKDIRYVIAVSGAIIYDMAEDKYIYRFPLDPTLIAALFREVRNEDLMVHIHGDNSYVQKDKITHMGDYNMGIYQRFFEQICVTADNLEEKYLREKFRAYKFNMYCRNEEQRKKLRDRLSDMPATISYAEISSLEFSPQNTTKGTGLVKLCELLQIPLKRSIAVGDAENDIDIIKCAGLGVAMGNANPAVLKEADIIVKDNDSGGCAQTIYDYLLKEI